MSNPLLNGLSPAQFLRRHWQKKPLLARAALPQFASLVTRRDLFEMARSADTESRLILRNGRRWQVNHGPFTRRDFAQLPARNWTLLVQGVNHVLPQAQALLAQFAFIPYARLDDLMVSFAPPGGGVGPHFDSYDVFLLQGEGRRRWRVSRQRDLALVEGAPLKILRDFRAGREWELAPGDLLYLPPRCAHDGVALEECITCSIGFFLRRPRRTCAAGFSTSCRIASMRRDFMPIRSSGPPATRRRSARSSRRACCACSKAPAGTGPTCCTSSART